MLFRKIKGIAIVVIICIGFSIVALSLQHYMITEGRPIEYIIDAGHGIPDGGAVGADGTTEQELNLAIALRISKLLNESNISIYLTRDTAESVYTEGETIHQKKVSDTKKRIEIANSNPTVPFISIHMNSYPDPSVHGIQVFYSSAGEDSKRLAEKMQNAFNQGLQPDNTKVVKSIPKNIYLFSHIENPCILIECGFVSNQSELTRLKTEEYQHKIAKIVVDVLTSNG